MRRYSEADISFKNKTFLDPTEYWPFVYTLDVQDGRTKQYASCFLKNWRKNNPE